MSFKTYIKNFFNSCNMLYIFIAGDTKDFTIEHRIFNRIVVFLVLCGLLALVLNSIVRVPFIHQVILTISICFLSFFFYVSRFLKAYNLALGIVIVLSFFLIPVGFFTNNGIDGGFQYFMLVAIILAMALFSTNRRWLLFTLFLTEILGCIFVQYSFPQYVIGYPDSLSRYLDVVFAISLSLFIASAVVMHLKSEYDRERIAAQESANKLNILAKNNEYFIKVFAHDIKNCLQANAISLGVLTLEYPEDNDLRNLADINRHISRMVLNLINASSFETFNIQKVPVLTRDIFISAIKVWQPKFMQKKISFDVKLFDSAQVYIDSRYMDLVWDNLLANAYQNTLEGGVFYLKAVEEQERFAFSFINSGSIVPLEKRDFLFEKYNTAKEHSVYSKGLGLHCSALIIGKHGGSIIYRVTHDGLNEFVVYLPKVI